MDEPSQAFAPDLSPAGSKRWVGRLIVAVIVGLAVWNFVVSLTVNSVIPALARLLPADPQSPYYLGTGNYNVGAFFTSVLELCFAAIAAALVSAWTNKSPKPARRKSPNVASLAPSPIVPASTPAPRTVHTVTSSVAAPAAPPSAPPAAASQPPVAPQMQAAQRQATQPQAPPAAKQPSKAAPAEPAKPPRPKKVYYNLVGEPVEADEDQ
jgi:hypothetical protein